MTTRRRTFPLITLPAPLAVQTLSDGAGTLTAIEVDHDGTFWGHVTCDGGIGAYPMGELTAIIPAQSAVAS